MSFLLLGQRLPKFSVIRVSVIVSAVGAAGFLVACGGGGSSSGGGTGSGGGNGTLTWDQRVAAMNAASTKLGTIPITTDPATESQQMATYVKTLPNVSAASAAKGVVTVTMTDGSHFGIYCNRQPTESQVKSVTPPPSSRASLELPGSSDAVIMNPLGAGFFDVTGRIKTEVDMESYAGRIVSPTLDNLKALGKPGIVYFESHGGTVDGVYTVWTASLVPSLKLFYTKDLSDMEAAGEIVPAISHVSTGVEETHWAITPAFVAHYWTGFDTNSLVMIDACGSGDPNFSLGVAKACSEYVGWTEDTNSGGPAVMLFDRLLGLNTYIPESPNQRSFNLGAIVSDMKTRGLDTNGLNSTSHFTITPGPKGSFGLLAPSIESMFVNENAKTLVIDGLFGNDPGQTDGQVYIGGVPASSRTWSEKEIIVNNLPVSGDGSHGDVYVLVRKHKSNVIPLTNWKGDFTLTYTGRGTIHVTGPITIHFRGDVHEFREAPHVTPTQPVYNFDAASDSKAHYTASGSGTLNSATTTLSGSSDMTLDGAGGNVLKCLGTIDTKTKTLNLGLIAASTSGMQFVTTGPGGTAKGPFAMSTGKLDGNLSSSQPIPALHIKLADDFTIPASSRTETIGNGTLLLKWSNIKPDSPPTPELYR